MQRAETDALKQEIEKQLNDAVGLYPDSWANRSMEMKCKSCMWYVEKGAKAPHRIAAVGRCRRHAPTMSGYPVVYESDWCGDHKVDELK